MGAAGCRSFGVLKWQCIEVAVYEGVGVSMWWSVGMAVCWSYIVVFVAML